MTGDPYASAAYRRNRRITLEAAGWRCQRCHQPANTADHIIPLAAGGSHDLENLRALCQSCNSQGGAEITNQIRRNKHLGRRSRRW